MLVEKYTIQACCGNKVLIFKTSRPISINDINGLVAFGFTESKNFTQAGILYVNNSELIITGPIGFDRLQIQCKLKDCIDKVDDFVTLLQQLG